MNCTRQRGNLKDARFIAQALAVERRSLSGGWRMSVALTPVHSVGRTIRCRFKAKPFNVLEIEMSQNYPALLPWRGGVLGGGRLFLDVAHRTALGRVGAAAVAD